MFPTLQEFSEGYYILAPMYVEPHEVSSPRISDRLYQFMQSQVLDGFERVILKCRSQVFEVEPSRSVTPETLALPRYYVREEMDIRHPPEEVTAYVAKSDVAQRLLGIEKERELLDWDEP